MYHLTFVASKSYDEIRNLHSKRSSQTGVTGINGARKDGEREFKVQVERISGTGFELFVNGVKRGDLRMSARSR